MLDQVLQTLNKFQMVESGDRILVGLSGGADSVCLLYILVELKTRLGLEVQAVHVHHGLRGEEADQDAGFSKMLCEKLKVPFHLVYRNISEEAARFKMSIEEAGRRARYEVFDTLKTDLGFNKIAVAHHMNDQAETVLFNLMRGSGLKGLGGMKPVRDQVIRPLMACSRAEIEAFCELHKLEFIEDSSNSCDDYSRNKIRHHIIPYMEANFNASVVSQLSHMSELLREDLSFLEQEAEMLFRQVLKEATEMKVILKKDLLLNLHPAMRKRIYLIAIKHLGKELTGYESKHLSMVDGLIFMGTGKKVSLFEGLFVENVYQEVHFSITWEKSSFWEYILLKNDTMIEIKEIASNVYTRVFDYKNTMEIGENRYTKWFDYDKIIFDLTLRNRRDGDFLYLKDSRHKKKLKDYFIDQKIPREERSKIPLLTVGSNVLWIIGYRGNDVYGVNQATKKILEVRLLAEEPKDAIENIDF